MPSTSRGYPYPADTDPIAAGAAAIAAIAQKVNDELGLARRGSGTVTAMPAAGTAKTITVNFTTPFPAGITPHVVVSGTAANRDVYSSAFTNTGFDVTAVNSTGTGNVGFTYIALG